MLAPLLMVSAMSISVWFASRWLKAEADRVESQMRRLEQVLQQLNCNTMPSLHYNPATGVYHPVRRISAG